MKFKEPIYHYHMDHFMLISPILYKEHHKVIHVGGGPNRNHPLEINVNIREMENVDVVADAANLPFEDASVDVVISNAVLEHVEDINSVVAEMERVLKPGGYIYIEIPFMQGYHTHDFYGVQFEDYRRYTKKGLENLFPFARMLDTSPCVGPTSAFLQMNFSYLKALSSNKTYTNIIDAIYKVTCNPIVYIDAFLSKKIIRNSPIPFGVYYFGRKKDDKDKALAGLPYPNSIFAAELSASYKIVKKESEHLMVKITNTGDSTWLTNSPLEWGTVKVGVQLRDTDGNLNKDFKRVPLPSNVGPGETTEIKVSLQEIRSLGNIKSIRFDLISEGLLWFEQSGSRVLEIKL